MQRELLQVRAIEGKGTLSGEKELRIKNRTGSNPPPEERWDGPFFPQRPAFSSARKWKGTVDEEKDVNIDDSVQKIHRDGPVGDHKRAAV
ncbi:hypothetical protein N7532_002063 [Penicillium argentinense]|uniref:Uncharacterized protein n=1 Tax=Penicillium argentinense TaxID=1131581 RepID=A0A9W9G3Y5_9EURO|nr:uncharacterized protein N7532_002063 [Penicillium argentinense]KAJ5111528.1 hypothetical protein N7532_002063 [Penicillium argentinense]